MNSPSRIQMASSSKYISLGPFDLPDLLSDDDYRLLRQNAFEQHSTDVAVPTEAPVVPMSAYRHTPLAGMYSISFLRNSDVADGTSHSTFWTSRNTQTDSLT